MPVLIRAELDAALRAVGISRGDGLLAHSAIQFLGKPESGLQMYLDALLAAIGPTGTLAVPTFSFSTKEYDPAFTPSQDMGVFSEFVRLQPAALRTKHPMQSLAVIGAAAADLASRDTHSAFDPGSAFERMLELKFKLLLLGADIQSVSVVHYSEQRAQVPYRYWKDFPTCIKEPRRWVRRTYRMYARDLDLDPQLRLAPIQQALESKGQWHSVPVNLGRISCCRLVDFVGAADGLLAADPWALVANRPETAGR